MTRNETIRKIVRVVLLCVVIGSLFGGLVGVVVAGEAGPEHGVTVLTGQ